MACVSSLASAGPQALQKHEPHPRVWPVQEPVPVEEPGDGISPVAVQIISYSAAHGPAAIKGERPPSDGCVRSHPRMLAR